jgi:DNA-binding beta-propeller fold protein YncE
MVTVVDIQSNRVVANLTGIAGVHGVLAILALGRVYASATDAQQVVVIDERTLRVVARIRTGWPTPLHSTKYSSQMKRAAPTS